jgi:hypothetical protein
MAKKKFTVKGKGKGRGRKIEGSNDYGLGQFEFDEILKLNNKEIIGKASSEYANWMASEKLKKEDSELAVVTARIKELEEEIKTSDEYLKIKEKLDNLVEELTDESLARYKEEKKNLVEPYQEDIKRFRGSFKAAMDEINKRKHEGKLIIDGKII